MTKLLNERKAVQKKLDEWYQRESARLRAEYRRKYQRDMLRFDTETGT